MSHTKISRSRERHPSASSSTPGALDKRDAFFTNLLLLGFDKGQMENQFNVPFSRDMFHLPNKKCFEVVFHFLFERLNPAMAQDRFRYCWPVSDKKQEQAFRKVVNSWLTEIKEEEESNLPRIVPSLFLSPGGDKFYNLLLHFSRYVVHKVILNENGMKERELLHYPQMPSKDQELTGQVGRALQASCVRHRKSFLMHLQTDLLLQEQWSTYASELVAEYRHLMKELRNLDQRIRQEESLLLEQANSRGSPSGTKRRRSGALLDAEWDMMAVRRTQKVQKVRDMWKAVESCHSAQHQEREVVESILQRTANQYRVDGAELSVQVPEMLLRECHKEIEKRNISNVYEGGKLNLLPLIQLWNLSLRLYLEKIHQAPPADFDSLHSEVVTQVHTHHAHLTNLQSLRSSMSHEVLPAIKSSIQSLKRQLELGYEAPTRDGSRKTNRSPFLVDGMGLMPATPPVSFEPANQAHADDTPVRPINKAFWKPSPTTDTPEAVSSLSQNVNRVVERQGTLTQGTPTSTLKLLRDQINRPSRLPKPVHADNSEGRQLDKRRIKSAPPKTSPPNYFGETQTDDDSTLKVDDSKMVPSSVKKDKVGAGTAQKKTARESRTGKVTDRKPFIRPTPKSSVKKSERKVTVSRSSRTFSTPAPVRSTPSNRNRIDTGSSSVTRAHQVLIDQIADAVVGAMSGSPEFKGLMDMSPSAPDVESPPPLPLGIEDPLSVLDQSAFITRDKLKHSPINPPGQYINPEVSSPLVHSKPSPTIHQSKNLHHKATLRKETVTESPLHQFSHNTNNYREEFPAQGRSEILQGMEDDVPEEHKIPVGSLITLDPTSPAHQYVSNFGTLSSSRNLDTEDLRQLSQKSPMVKLNQNGRAASDDHSFLRNSNNSRMSTDKATDMGPSPVQLSADSCDSSPVGNVGDELSLEDQMDKLLRDLTPKSETSDTSPLGLVQMDQQLSEIFGTRTPQLPSRMKSRASSASPGSVFNGSSSSPHVDDAKGRLDFGSSPISGESQDILENDAFELDDITVRNGHDALNEQDNDLLANGNMNARNGRGSKKHGSEGSQKSVTFSDHVDERNISTYSISSELNGSFSNREVFATDDFISSPVVRQKTLTKTYSPAPKTYSPAPMSYSPTSKAYSPTAKAHSPGSKTISQQPEMEKPSSVSSDVYSVDDMYLSPSERPNLVNSDLEVSPLEDIISLDDTTGNDQDDFLSDNSTRLEDLLVHVSPTITPSTTPKLTGSRGGGGDSVSTSFGSATTKSSTKAPFRLSPDNDERFSLPANIVGLSHGSPLSPHDASLLRDLSNLRLRTPGKASPNQKASHTLSPGVHATPKSAMDFDLLDEDESVLLPPSPYTQSPSQAVGQLIDI